MGGLFLARGSRAFRLARPRVGSRQTLGGRRYAGLAAVPIRQELIGAMRVVASVGLVSSSVSRLLHRNALRSACARPRSSNSLRLRCCVPRLLRCCVPCLLRTHLGVGRVRPGPERKLLLLDNTQSKKRNKSEQEGDHDSFGGILAARGRMQTRGQIYS